MFKMFFIDEYEYKCGITNMDTDTISAVKCIYFRSIYHCVCRQIFYNTAPG